MIKKIFEDYILVKSWKGVLFHLILVLFVAAGLVNYYFNSYLPEITHHGQEIEAPSLENMTLVEARAILDEKKLTFVVTDTIFSKRHQPLTIVNQQPKSGAKVKEGRKIYLTINSSDVPKIHITENHLRSLISGYITLNSKLTNLKLEMGDITYVPGPYENLVDKIYYKGKELKAGDVINQGSKLDFDLQDGKASHEQPKEEFDHFDNNP